MFASFRTNINLVVEHTHICVNELLIQMTYVQNVLLQHFALKVFSLIEQYLNVLSIQ